MHLSEKELSPENYRRLGLRELEELYQRQIIPGISASMEAAGKTMETVPDIGQSPESYKLAVLLFRQIVLLYLDHAEREVELFFALRTRNAQAPAHISLLLEEHREIRNLFAQVSQLSVHCRDEAGCSSAHKLAYARINNLHQDIMRLFFLEEEYLFPRLIARQKNAG